MLLHYDDTCIDGVKILSELKFFDTGSVHHVCIDNIWLSVNIRTVTMSFKYELHVLGKYNSTWA